MTAMYLYHHLHCKDCGLPMMLHAEMIQQLFDGRDESSNDYQAIAVACRLCKSVDTYILSKQITGYNPKDQVYLTESLYADVVFLDRLECEAEGCGIRVPLFADWSPASTAEERTADIGTWQWENLKCPKGHSIPKP